MALQVYNTLTRRKEAFEPLDPSRVTMYACGPTVYDHPHVGNARPAVVFDLLFRVLRRHYDNVVYARNITDIEDKINAAAKAAGVDISVINQRFTAAYHADMTALKVLEPTLEPRATEHVPEMISMIEALIERGHAYPAEGHVLFHVPSYTNYGVLSGQNRDEQMEGARVEVAPYKRDAVDFVLWKPSTDDLPGWESPWGRGRPGWHLECSCMIEAHLGRTIDIHAGGSDLIFPHHENEIAQTTCAHDGELFCRYWMHNGFVNINREKMAKSQGNVLLVKQLLEQAPGEAIRLALLTAHYRSPLDWSDETLEQAARRLDRLYGTLRHLPSPDAEANPGPPTDLPEGLVAALDDDLNTPVALAELAALARAANSAASPEDRIRLRDELLASGRVLGLLEHHPDDWFELRFGATADVAAVNRLVAARHDARMDRDFERADQLRTEIEDRGVILEDGAEGTTWRPASRSSGDD